MPLSPGDKLGPYTILALAGKGGMGEVYRAHDDRLRRDVAIKVSRDQFTERFTREARTIASLNHTNIAHLYDVGPNYLVMEYVEGDDLKGPLDFEDALPIIQQLIDGIEAAHEKNIIHRDLKPANIKITPEGVVKILDFGLAKAMEPPPSHDDDPGNSPTLTMGATVAGTILGTAAYMAPEQAKGKAADKRSDVWSFGVVVYEMLTGKRLFQGESVVEILGGVLNKEPDFSAAPQRVHKLLRWCLEKDRKQRLASISDARRLLTEADTVPSPSQPSRSSFGILPWAAVGVAGALAVALAALAFLHFRETPAEERSYRFQLQPPDKSGIGAFRLSPDGRHIAFIAQSKVWVRSLDSLESRALDGTEGATYPFWSPDSENVGFFSQGKLKRIPRTGGAVQTICNAATGRGAAWNKDGVIVFSPGPTATLFRVAAVGGVPVAASKFQESSANQGHRFPEFLPDGQHFLYNALSDKPEESGVFVGGFDGAASRLLPEVSNAIFSPGDNGSSAGYLLFRRLDTLMVQPFDSQLRKLTGDAVPFADKVGQTANANTGFGAFSAALDGTLSLSSGEAGSSQLELLDRSGKRIRVLTEPAPMQGINQIGISPDNRKIAYATGNAEEATIWIQDLSGGAASRFTFSPGRNGFPVWSPDGTRIAYTLQGRTGSTDLFIKPSSGAGKEELFLRLGVNGQATDWSPDGKTLAIRFDAPSTDLWLLPLEGVRKPVLFLQTPFAEGAGQFSPDGKFLAYTSDESGRSEIYVQPVPANGSKWQISKTGGAAPRWRRDGKELFYRTPTRNVMAVPVQIGSTITAGSPQMLFEAPSLMYAPLADGQKFVMAVPADGSQVPPLTVVTNWQAGLKK